MFEAITITDTIKTILEGCNITGFTVYKDTLNTLEKDNWPLIAIYVQSDRQIEDCNSDGSHQRQLSLNVCINMIGEYGVPISTTLMPIADTIAKALIANSDLEYKRYYVSNLNLSIDVNKNDEKYIEGNVTFDVTYNARIQ